jgi:hypothetical protein
LPIATVVAAMRLRIVGIAPAFGAPGPHDFTVRSTISPEAPAVKPATTKAQQNRFQTSPRLNDAATANRIPPHVS